MAGYSAYLAYAEQAGFTARPNPFMGLNDPKAAGLRCFRRYSREATVDITDLGGYTRWLTQKQSRIYAILDRDSSNGNRVLKMKDIASEAMVCISTVSRTVVKLQAFGLFAIDVTRGRHGGIVVRKRHIGDSLRHYADAAWKRIRAWINVASTISPSGKGQVQVLLPKVATFSGANCDGRCTNLLDCSTLDHTPLAHSATSRAADEAYARAREFGMAVIAERRLLDAGEPDWDLYLDNVRASYGWD